MSPPQVDVPIGPITTDPDLQVVMDGPEFFHLEALHHVLLEGIEGLHTCT
jgi:hypothetical protein